MDDGTQANAPASTATDAANDGSNEPDATNDAADDGSAGNDEPVRNGPRNAGRQGGECRDSRRKTTYFPLFLDITCNPEYNQADANYLQAMTEHHRGAIEMAEMVPNRTDRPELMNISEQISEVQEAEIEQIHPDKTGLT